MIQEFPQENEGIQGERPENQPGKMTKWMESLVRLGLGETAVRIGTNVLTVLFVVLVVWLMQALYQQANLGWTPSAQAASDLTPTPAPELAELPAEVLLPLNGVARLAIPHTTIPSRPRLDVEQYTVQPGDSVFSIAEKFGLEPTTILFGNYDTLKDSPDSLRPGQTLNILPVDGVYHPWTAGGDLNKWAAFFGVEAEAIIDSPANHLDPDTIGDLSNPNIPDGTWLVVPGGTRAFTSWTAPAQLVQANPSSGVWGPGVCTGINYVQVGYGTFIYPTVEHWLSGTPYRPDLNHFGVDFAGQLGNAVYAADAGTVVYAGWNDWGYGYLIILDHGNGWESRYAHLSQINVVCGQNVGQGDIIGLVGSTGNSTGPHLHFELVNTQLGRVNPLDYLPPP